MEKSEIETIYRKYFHDVFLYIRALSENESLAEEITQETFLKAMNNIEKFDEDFMFQLTDEEVSELTRSQNATLNKSAGRGSNIKYNPHAFTEQGIYMLMTVLKGELAVKQSKALICTFKQMKDYIVENQGLIGKREFLQLSMQITSNVVEMQDLRRDLRDVEEQVVEVMDTLNNVVHKSELSDLILDLSNPQLKYGFLLLNGQPIFLLTLNLIL